MFKIILIFLTIFLIVISYFFPFSSEFFMKLLGFAISVLTFFVPLYAQSAPAKKSKHSIYLSVFLSAMCAVTIIIGVIKNYQHPILSSQPTTSENLAFSETSTAVPITTTTTKETTTQQSPSYVKWSAKNTIFGHFVDDTSKAIEFTAEKTGQHCIDATVSNVNCSYNISVIDSSGKKIIDNKLVSDTVNGIELELKRGSKYQILISVYEIIQPFDCTVIIYPPDR